MRYYVKVKRREKKGFSSENLFEIFMKNHIAFFVRQRQRKKSFYFLVGTPHGEVRAEKESACAEFTYDIDRRFSVEEHKRRRGVEPYVFKTFVSVYVFPFAISAEMRPYYGQTFEFSRNVLQPFGVAVSVSFVPRVEKDG